MKLAIVGSRTFDDYDKLKYYMEFIDGYNYKFELIVSGGAKGADALAKRFAAEHSISTATFLPDWNKYGKPAGYRRNKLIVDACDIVLAFWDGKSKGTEHTISLAKKAKKPTFIIYF